MITPLLPTPLARPLYGTVKSRAIEQAALSVTAPHELMARAGLASARLAVALAPHAQTIWIACGPGNNGGDGLVAARWLHGLGKQVRLSLIGDAARLPSDAAEALQQAQAAGVPISNDLPAANQDFDLAIDALLGLGVSRAVEGALGQAIAALNALPCPVLALDLPSGLSGDTGQALGALVVQAQHTLALLSLKPGLFTGSGRERAGRIWFDDLGITPSAPVDARLLGLDACAHWMQPRRHGQHKGSFGDVIVLGGAPGMGGAARLAARAAHAAGAGRVYLSLLDEEATGLTDATRPELMTMAWRIAQTADAMQHRTVVCGCGGGALVAQALPALLALAPRLVLDADALNAIAADGSLQTLLSQRSAQGLHTVLTPHPLEAARLLGSSTSEIQADRLAAADHLSQRFQCIVVLKGSGSVIASPGHTPAINSSGNAALATAGTGDVLAGWLGGLWAQETSTPESGLAAASAACHWHGLAADHGGRSLLRAADLIEAMFAL
ncbi:MAG: NAD(P)H-hydrate dehydratase [Burkholderiaceae bacterium]|nr:NAD(P)H-hydrate dehydratase [Burkholderiaceae bacterium]